jgi:hypothetical protein
MDSGPVYLVIGLAVGIWILSLAYRHERHG